MRIILSPAKQMCVRSELPHGELPVFLHRSEELLQALQALSPLELRTLWKCSDRLVMENLARLHETDLYRDLTPALFAYDGIAFQYLDAATLKPEALANLQAQLRILSGFYGILRPDDGVVPYRLEMQAKLRCGSCRDLYEFWGSSLHEELSDGSGQILDLASQEYSRSIRRHLAKGEQLIECVFAQLQGGKPVQKGVYAKMARGSMVRFIAENGITRPEEVQGFHSLGFSYAPNRSNSSCYVFLAQDVAADADSADP